MKKNIHSHRKDEHISLAEKFYQTRTQSGFDRVRIIPCAVPELNLSDITINTSLAGLSIDFPFFIQAMTGGSEQAKQINQKLAMVAKKTGIPMAVGSESVALKNIELSDSFTVVRDTNPNGIIIGNVGADTSPENAQKAIDLIQANILQVHLNVIQELIMPEGDKNFKWMDNIKNIINYVNVPVIVKSVGFGLSEKDINAIHNKTNSTFFDVGGFGGTNFAKIENFRRPNKDMDYLKDIGFDTVESLIFAQKTNISELSLSATGGIRNPSDIFKSLALGADNVGIAGHFLHILIKNDENYLIELIENWKEQLKKIMLITGTVSIENLGTDKIIVRNNIEDYHL